MDLRYSLEEVIYPCGGFQSHICKPDSKSERQGPFNSNILVSYNISEQ